MRNSYLDRKAKGEKILLSELLAAPPSDEILCQLFPYNRNNRPYISQSGLEILNLRLAGLSAKAVGEKLSLTLNQVTGRFQTIRVHLMMDNIPDYIEIDTPGIRQLRRMDVPITSGYIKVSELLRDMSSDQELLKLSIARGHIIGITGRRILSHDDLTLLQRKAAGLRNTEIARERGFSDENVRRRLVWIHRTLRQKLGIQIDVPGLFPDEDE